ELVSAPPVKFFDRAHQSDVALLNQVKEMQPSIDIVLCYRNYQAEVSFNHLALRLLDLSLSGDNRLLSPFYVNRGGRISAFRFTGRLTKRALLTLEIVDILPPF